MELLLTVAPSAVSHARLRLRHQVSEGLHRLSLLLQDSGEPPQQREQTLNVTVCRCGTDGTCLPGAAALLAGGVGVSLGALVIVLASTVVLLGECRSLVLPSLLDPFPTLSPLSAHTAASLSCFHSSHLTCCAPHTVSGTVT